MVLLALQSPSTELGLSPPPVAPELPTPTWQILGESTLFSKVLQPHSLCAIGKPSENRDTAHFLPCCSPGTQPAPPRTGSGVRGKGTESLAAPQSPAGQEPALPKSCCFSHPVRLMSGPAPPAPSACKGQLQRLLQGVKPAAGSAGENLCFAFGFVKGKERSAWACGGG